MKSLLCTSLILIGAILLNYSNAYSPLSASQHQQIDLQLEAIRELSKQERKEKSDFFYRLAQKSLAIRKAFLPLNTKIHGTPLTPADQDTVQKRIMALWAQSPEKRKLILKDMEQTQYMAEELARSIQLENSPHFQGYAKTILPTPLFRFKLDEVDINKSLGGQWTTGINLDGHNLIREVAVVLPAESNVLLMQKREIWAFTYYQVRTREFDAGPGAKFGYFLDARFIEKVPNKSPEKLPQLPPLTTITSNLLKTKGAAYVRGGSRYEGIPEINTFFPSGAPLSPLHQTQKELKGVDCSWLIYQATDGYTPRNTRQLLTFWEEVQIEGKTLEQIIKTLKPLDLIAWAGHVVIVLDQEHTIESRWRADFKWGVEIVPLKERLAEILKTRTPVDHYYTSPLPNSKKFSIRRRYPENR